MKPTRILPLIALTSIVWSQGAQAQLLLGDTIGIDFGTIAPTSTANFNQFDGNANPIVDGATLAFSAQSGAPAQMINTAGSSVAGVGFTVENKSGQSTNRANVTNGSAGPAPFDDDTIYEDILISNNQGSAPLNSGGFLVLSFSGLDDSLAYDLVGGFDGANNNFDTTWTAGGTSILSAPGSGYATFSGLATDGSGNLVIVLTRNTLHVNAAALTLTAVTPTAAADIDGDGIADSFEENFFPGDLTQLNGLATGPGPGAGSGDFDGDGLTDLQEFDLAVTNAIYPTLSPVNADSDGDNLSDGVEDDGGVYVSSTQTGTSPVNADSDGDSFNDGVETNSGTFNGLGDPGTNPTLPDTDGDGFDDRFEAARGGDPLDINSLPDLSEGYTVVGSNWMSAADFGAADINGDGLGSDGFLFFGNFTGTPNGSLAFTDRVESLPSYVSAVTASAIVSGVTSGFPEFGSIDNPSLSDGSDQIAGYVFSLQGGLNTNHQLFTFDIGGTVAGQVIRLGILGGVDGNDDGRFDPSRIVITMPDGSNQLVTGLGANPGLVNAGWVFFDVTQEGTYTVQARRRTSGGEGGAALGGITFDSTVQLAFEAPALCVVNDPSNAASLLFSWESSQGFEYDLVSDTDLTNDPSTWAVYNDGATLFENIAASGTGTTSLSNVARIDGTRFFALRAKPLPLASIFSTDFEADAGGFFTNDVPALWELGTPNSSGAGGIVQSANSGIIAWGTDLDAVYPANTTSTLSSPVIDLTGLSVSASLSFFENLDLETGTSGEVWVVNNATGTDIGSSPIYTAVDQDINSTAWESVGPIDLPSGAIGEMIRLEFRYTSANATDFLGWYIDDVTVEGL